MNSILDNDLFEVFANASDKIYMYLTDMKTHITRWSLASVEYFNLPGEYVENADEIWLGYIHPEDRHIFINDISMLLSGKSIQHSCQYRVRNRFGEYVWVECKGNIIYSDDSTKDLFAGVMIRLDNRNKYDPITHLLTEYELMTNSFDEPGVLMTLGINDFRNISSQHGMSYGNRVLLYMAKILTLVAKNAIVYRFHGAEFVIYGKGMTVNELIEMYIVIRTLCLNPSTYSRISGFTVTGSIISFSGDEGSLSVLAKNERCYNYAKENPISDITVYSDEIEGIITRKELISEKLLSSIKNDYKGFRLVYQPIFSNTGDNIVGCEALLRYHTTNEYIGSCYPDEFIGILEANGGMRDVGYYTMKEAIRQTGEWQKQYKYFYVSFNVSYVQLEDEAFVPAIIETIDKYGVDPNRIVVELTESILNIDTNMVQKSFELLRNRGIKIALDDFGTGNSSFFTLHHIDVDIVKLDQSFIRGLENADGIDYAIVKSISTMCKHIGCKTIAEGVENENIWKLINEFKFEGLQGYNFSKPIEVAAFEAMLDKHNMKQRG